MRKIIYIFVAILLCACNTTQSENVVAIDFDNVKTVDINDGEIVGLEATDKSLLSYIGGLIVCDDKFFVLSREEVFAFDRSGHYLFNVGCKGHAGGEYTHANCIFMRDDSVVVYDWQAHKILFYDTDGKYLSTTIMESSKEGWIPNFIYPLSTGGYLVTNVFNGIPGVETPVFGRLDNEFVYEYPLSGIYRKDGMFMNVGTTVGEANTLLFSNLFSDYVYRATPDSREAKLAFHIDFGEHKFPESLKAGKEVYELLQISNTEDFIENIAILWSANETEEKLRCVFSFRREVHYVEYDKKSGDVKTIKINDPKGKLDPIATLFTLFTDDAFYISAVNKDMDSNPYLVRFGYDVFD